jgi:hypothetical protein
MSSNRRNVRLGKKKQAEQALGTNPLALEILLSLAEENPGAPTRTYIRARCKEIVVANPDRLELLVDVHEILDLLTEAQLRRERLLAVRKTKPVPPFPVPPNFAGKFRWVFRVSTLGEIQWQLIEAA